MLMVPGEGSRPEWRSGRSPATPVDCWPPPYPTFSHSATLFPTFPSDRCEFVSFAGGFPHSSADTGEWDSRQPRDGPTSRCKARCSQQGTATDVAWGAGWLGDRRPGGGVERGLGVTSTAKTRDGQRTAFSRHVAQLDLVRIRFRQVAALGNRAGRSLRSIWGSLDPTILQSSRGRRPPGAGGNPTPQANAARGCALSPIWGVSSEALRIGTAAGAVPRPGIHRPRRPALPQP